MVRAINYHWKWVHRRYLPGFLIWLNFRICQVSKYTRVLNMPLVLNILGSEYIRVLNIPRFIIHKDSEYVSGSGYVWVCLGSWIYQGSEYASVTQGSELAWIYLIMSEYAGIFFTFPHCNPLSTGTHV